MTTTIRLTYTFFLALPLYSYAQPGDLTHPAQRSNSAVLYQRTYSSFDTVPPLVIFDGIPLRDINSIKNFDAGSIASVETDKKAVRIQPEQKFLALVEISTIAGRNDGVKYIKSETKNWIRRQPLAAILFNGRVLEKDQEKAGQSTSSKAG